MASEATALTAVEAAAAAPEASAPTKIDDVSLDALDAARGCAYAVFFSLSVAWGIWAEVYTFFLEGVGGYGPDHAAAISSYSLLVYAGGQCVMMPVLGALSDRCGRRALLLGAFTLDAAFMAANGAALDAKLSKYSEAQRSELLGKKSDLEVLGMSDKDLDKFFNPPPPKAKK